MKNADNGDEDQEKDTKSKKKKEKKKVSYHILQRILDCREFLVAIHRI